jgi:uncharacterized protein
MATRSNRLLNGLAAIGYLLLITLAELLINYVQPNVIGAALYAVILFGLFSHSAALWNDEDNRLLTTGLALIPIFRLVGIALPQHKLPFPFFDLFGAVLLFIAALLAIHALDVPAREFGISARNWALQPMIIVIGVGLGLLQNLLLTIKPLERSPSDTAAVVTLVISVFLMGSIEEFVFRGVIQIGAVRVLGQWFGPLYVAILNVILHMTNTAWELLLFSFIISLILGFLVASTKNVFGSVIGRGLMNVLLLLGIRSPL